MKNWTILKQSVIAMAIVINMICGFLALAFQLPIYLDSIGTVWVASLLGPFYGAATGLLTGLANGLTFDVCAFYFIPAQIITGWAAGMIYKKRIPEGKRLPFSVFAISVPTSIVSAVVAAYVFNGLTSSNSAYLVMVMSKMGLDLVVSCFLVQVITDFIDEMISVAITNILSKALPKDMKAKIRSSMD